MITGRSRFGERAVGEPPDAGQPEDDLGEQRAARDQRAEVEPEQADEADHRGPQRVADEHAALRDPLGARGAHEVLALRLDQRRAQHAAVEADVEDRQRDPRDHEVLEPQHGVLGQRRVAERRHPAEQERVVPAVLREQVRHRARARTPGSTSRSARAPSAAGPRRARAARAAATPMTMLMTTHSTAAPSTSESVTGVALAICGSTSTPRLENDCRSREIDQPVHHLQRTARAAAGRARTPP